MTNLHKLLDQRYVPQGGYKAYLRMREAGSTNRAIARHFNDVETRTVVRWNTMERGANKNKTTETIK